MSDTTARGFLDAIVAEPDDDTHRLIYSDWLEDNGDPERAEFIRVQTMQARLPKRDARQVGLRIREKTLLDEHRTTWLNELPVIPGVNWMYFRRGFVAEAELLDDKTLLLHRDRIWKAAPIERVSMSWSPREETITTFPPVDGLRELQFRDIFSPEDRSSLIAQSLLLSTVRVLDVRGTMLSYEDLAELLASPHLVNLETLLIGRNYLGNAGIGVLLEAEPPPKLAELDLSGGGVSLYYEDPVISASGVRTLVAWSGLDQLRSLDLRDQNIEREGLRTLLRSPRVAGLKELDISGNGLNGQALQEFTAAHPDLRLERLDLGRNPFGELGVAYLARSECLSELKSLSLERCELPPGAARELASAPFFERLEHLDLADNRLRTGGVKALVEALPRGLLSLSMRDADIDDEGVILMANSSMSDTLRELDLSHNGDISDGVVGRLIASDQFVELLSLNLAHCDIGPKSFEILEESPLGQRLGELLSHYFDGEIPF